MKINFKKIILENKKNKGFTLVETLVAVLVLTIAVTALLNLVSTSLSAFQYSRDEITANYLIQEAVDSVRNQRDSRVFLADGLWSDYLSIYGSSTSSTGCFSSLGCNTDAKTGAISFCSKDVNGNDPCSYLSYSETENSSGGFYSTSSSTGSSSSIFKRQINMSVPATNPNELDVIITVQWDMGSTTRTRALNYSLLNWR